MAGLTQSSNLPGMMSEFKDGGLQLRQQATAATTESVLILGTAVDGPVMEPVAVDSSTAELVFGTALTNGVPNGATLPEAFKRIYAEGCRDIRMMRISGIEASSKIATAAVTDDQTLVKKQTLGLVGGNDEQVFQLSKTNIIPASVIMFGGSKQISVSKLTIDAAAGKITLAKDSMSVGTDITIKYDYFPLVNVPAESFVATAGQTVFTLANIPAGTVTAKVNGVDNAGFTVSGKDVTFGTALTEADAVVFTYDYLSAAQASVTENTDKDGKQLIASAAAKQSFDLDKIPLSGSLRLYIDGREIVAGASFSIDVTGTPAKLLLDKSYFSMGASVYVGYYYTENSTYTPEIVLKSYYGGSLYNDCQREVVDVLADNGDILGKKLVLTKPLLKRDSMDESPLEYSSIDYPTFGMLVSAINSDSNNGVIMAEIEDSYLNTATANLLISAKTNFTGGDNGLGLTKDQMFKALSGERDSSGSLTKYGAYQILENYQVDYVIPCDIYMDDELVGKYDNFAYELALFCGVLSQTHLTHGIIATRPPVKTGLAAVEEYVKKLESYTNIWLMRKQDGTILTDNEGNPFDLGGYITVVAGPDITFTSDKVGKYNEVGCAQYAALSSRLKPSSATTNKKVVSASGLRYNFSVKQLGRLADKRYATFQLRSTDGAVIVTDGVTAARSGSDYSREVNIKVVRNCLEEIYSVAQPYIGEPPTAVNNNALSSAISKRLGLIQENGDIDGYDFQLISDDEDKLIGDSKLELNIVPPGERRRITVVVGLKKSL